MDVITFEVQSSFGAFGLTILAIGCLALMATMVLCCMYPCDPLGVAGVAFISVVAVLFFISSYDSFAAPVTDALADHGVELTKEERPLVKAPAVINACPSSTPTTTDDGVSRIEQVPVKQEPVLVETQAGQLITISHPMTADGCLNSQKVIVEVRRSSA